MEWLALDHQQVWLALDHPGQDRSPRPGKCFACTEMPAEKLWMQGVKPGEREEQGLAVSGRRAETHY